MKRGASTLVKLLAGIAIIVLQLPSLPISTNATGTATGVRANEAVFANGIIPSQTHAG